VFYPTALRGQKSHVVVLLSFKTCYFFVIIFWKDGSNLHFYLRPAWVTLIVFSAAQFSWREQPQLFCF
jgi:hypothetical protein